MELITITSNELNTLRKNDIIFDPNTQKLLEFRNREGKALLLREIGQEKISKILKNTLRNVLKVSSLQNYQLISIQDDSVTLFNGETGDAFDIGFGNLKKEEIEEFKSLFFNGGEISAHIFEYEDIKILINLEKVSQQIQDTEEKKPNIGKASEKELKLAKEIEKRKENRRPFEASKPKKKSKATTKPKTSTKKTTKNGSKSSTKTTSKKVTSKKKTSQKKETKKVKSKK